VVPNGVRLEDFQNSDANAFRREFAIAETQIIVGIVGRLTPWKGHKLFLEAAAQLIKDGYNVLFVIVGDDVDPVTGLSHYRANLEQYTTQLGLTNKVLFTGYRPDIPNVMSGLDVLVVPSIRPEPFGLVAIEAMACSKPVIAAAHGGLAEIVIDHSTGLTFVPGDVHSLIAAIRFLLEHRDLRGEYGHEGQYRVSKNFTLEYYVASMGRLFHI
jgi:glycosyltransferase involved in cell wall biosynthesis